MLRARTLRAWRQVYYRFGYHRRFPGKARLERSLVERERAAGRGDVPKGQEGWDSQYAEGGWEFLGGLGEIAHYATIVGYGAFLRPHGAVLDVGCGHGVLFERWRLVGYSRYVGVDISTVAVDRLRSTAPPDAEFFAADAEVFEPAETFDVVVFNESLTYFHRPEETFARYLESLAEGGVAIVSCHVQSPRAQAVQRALMDRYTVLDTTVVTQGSNAWRVAVLVPGTAGTQDLAGHP